MNPETNNTNRHFKGQLNNEVVESFCRKHWIVIVKDLIGFSIFLGLIVITGMYFKPIYDFFVQDSLAVNLLAFGLAGLFTFYIHRFFLRMINYFLEIVIITNYRIVVLKKSVYLKDSKDATDLPKIQDIMKHQDGILRNILRFGDLEITLSSSSTTKVLKNIPNPDYHFRKINKVKRNYIKERLGKSRQKQNGIKEQDSKPFTLEEPTFAAKDSLG